MSDEQRDGGSIERDADFSKLEDMADVGAGVAGGEGGVTGGGSSAVAALQAEVAEHKDRYLRALADLENYKKRALKERSELLKYQGERVIGDFLEVLDALELAMVHAESDPTKVQEGIKLIHKMFVDTLGRWEVRADSALGGDFDPVKHKAISRLVVGEKKAGTVVGELKKTYFYKDKLLRPGEVVVSAPPTDEASSSEQSPGGQAE
jgi:molecular chaperone GrpE